MKKRSSLQAEPWEVEDIGEAIVRSDLTDMTDIMMELMKEVKR